MTDLPQSEAPSKPPWNRDLLTLGLAFVGTGAALGSWFIAFRVVGIVLVVIGLLVLLSAAWQPARSFVATERGRTGFGRWLAPLLGLLIVGGVVAAAGWWRTTIDESVTGETPSITAMPSVSCIESAARCEMTASQRNPGEPLVWYVPDSMTQGSADGSLEVAARLDGDVGGRYVAIACRSTTQNGEYVLAVRPENRSFRLIRWNGDEMTDLGADRLPGTIHPANDLNRLQLRCFGPTIAASINDVLVATVRDATHGEGSWYLAAGIFAENTQPASLNAHFERIEMAPATPVAWGATPSSVDAVVSPH